MPTEFFAFRSRERAPFRGAKGDIPALAAATMANGPSPWVIRMKSFAGCLFVLLGTSVIAAEPPSPQQYRQIAEQAETSLQRDVLEKWFPAAVDRSHGGFIENFAADWSRGRDDERTLVYQSRLTWLAAQAARHDPAKATAYTEYSRHGAAFLAEKLWDHDHGGFYWAVDLSGKTVQPFFDEKHVYGIAFGIYAAAASYQVTHDAATLELAKKAFRWLDEHAHDAKSGGYFETLAADGKPIMTAPANRSSDAIGTRYGRKSMNTHIHVLEALTGLYEVWPDPAVRSRLDEVFNIARDKIYFSPGCLHMFLEPDWQPMPGVDSFGHDIEAAYLLVEAAAALGKPDDEAAWSAARHLVDHAMQFGFDNEEGGFYNEGTVDGHDLKEEKIWWVEAEGLNALLLMHERYGRQTPRYATAFIKQWDFIRRRQIDAVHGGWFASVGPNGKPAGDRQKSDRWTEGYHQGRALLNVTARLHKLAEAADATSR